MGREEGKKSEHSANLSILWFDRIRKEMPGLIKVQGTLGVLSLSHMKVEGSRGRLKGGREDGAASNTCADPYNDVESDFTHNCKLSTRGRRKGEKKRRSA